MAASRKLALVVALFTLYSVIFKVLYPSYGKLIGVFAFGAFVTIPVLAAAGLFGLRAGLLVWAISVPLELALLAWSGEAALQAMILNGGFLGLLLLSVIPVGRLHDLSLQVAREAAERKVTRETLLEKEKLQVALEKERELSQLKNRLMVTLSHEFRTPLSVILASGELLDRYFDRLTPARRAECLSTIKTQIMHLREMLDDISTMVGEGNFSPQFNPSPLDVDDFCRAMVDDFQASVGAAYAITFRSEGDCKAIPADANLLRPILKNLLSNGVKYSHKGGTVYCSLTRQGNEVRLDVRDEGIGIPAADQSRIFDTFHRASNALNVGGLGLGLRIVRDYVKLHGGTVDLQSAEGQGTTVTVRLPVEQPILH